MKEISLRYAMRYSNFFVYQNIKYKFLSTYSCDNLTIRCRQVNGRKEIELPVETIVQIEDESARQLKEELLIYKTEMEKLLPSISSDLKLLESQGV
jgi:chromosome condensin MukBEF complex kleisin-like MukF subunit